MTEKIHCLHPDSSKKGVNIDSDKYHFVKKAILDSIIDNGELKFMDLPSAVKKRLPSFNGSINWYVGVVKLDLEARGLIERDAKASPQILSLK